MMNGETLIRIHEIFKRITLPIMSHTVGYEFDFTMYIQVYMYMYIAVHETLVLNCMVDLKSAS